MNRLILVTGAAVGAIAIAVPAAAGLSGNPSFSQHVPVRVPSSATIVSFDDRGATRPAPRTSSAPHATSPTTAGHRPAEPGDDRGTHTEPGDDRGTHVEPGNDGSTHDGGATTRTATATRSEPGDDNHRNRGGRTTSPTSAASHGGDDTGAGHGGSHGKDD